MGLQAFSTIAGLASLVVTLVGAIFVTKSGIVKSTNEAQANAIAALQAEVNTLRNRIGDMEKENTRLEQTIQTICSALKMRGMVITVQGEMVNIHDDKGSTTTHIRGVLQSTEE